MDRPRRQTQVTHAELELADLAHRLWCEQMIEEGWSYAKEFDAVAKKHDALVEFKALAPVDRRATVVGVRSLEIVDALRRAPEYYRGHIRELTTAEMKPGLRVGYADDPAELGTVVSWCADQQFPECLETIEVRWDSGDTIEYAASERELRRLD